MSSGRGVRRAWAVAVGGVGASALLVGWLLGIAAGAEPSKEALIRDAVSAAPPAIARTVTVKDWDGTVLRKGSGAYTCLPTPAELRAKGGREPMCVDGVWAEWVEAWMHKKEFRARQVGIGYMLAGDAGASNVDPYAAARTPDNQWVVEGPHAMVLVPDPAQLEGLPTDPNSGGAYVMWKGTPYAHVMIPVGKRPAQKP